MRYIIFYKIIVTLLFTITSSVHSKTRGSDVPALIRDSYGARPIALGDTFTGIANDINTISVNPAGLNTIDAFQASVMYLKYPLNLNYGYLDLGAPLFNKKYRSFIAGSITFFGMPDITYYDSFGNETDRKLKARDLILTLAFANNPLRLFGSKKNFNIGFALKYIKTQLNESDIDTFALDTGFLYKFSIKSLGPEKIKDNFGIGFSIQNIHVSKKESDSIYLPENSRLGFGYNFFKTRIHNFLAGCDFNFANDTPTIVSAGLEYTYYSLISLRGGYKISGVDIGNLSMGIGCRFLIKENLFRIDYSAEPIENMGVRHGISINITFNKTQYRVRDEDHMTMIVIGDQKKLLFQHYQISKQGFNILDKIIEDIKKKNYKRINIKIRTFQLEEEEREYELEDQQIKKLVDYFVSKGIDQNCISSQKYIFLLPERYISLSHTDEYKKRYEISIIEWEKDEQKSFMSHYVKGEQAFETNNYNLAESEWIKALKIDPDNEELKKKIFNTRKKREEDE